jgi:hypothetical protein
MGPGHPQRPAPLGPGLALQAARDDTGNEPRRQFFEGIMTIICS